MNQHSAASASLVPGRLRGIVFTDLDGTLLDFETFSPSPAATAMVEELLELGVITVPVTSKTLSEVRHLAAMLPLAPLAAVEGGAVLYQAGEDPRLLGASRSALITILRILQGEGWPLRGLSEMNVGEVVAITGLSADASKRALERLASEPFVFVCEPPAAPEALASRVSELGGNLVRGGRLWHLLGAGIDKGVAVEVLKASIPRGPSVPAAAVGDAWNDLEMLGRADHRYLLGTTVRDADLPWAVERLAERGPAGFVEAMQRFRSRLETD